jgi:cytochrome c oxidase cbb3-type subunit 2
MPTDAMPAATTTINANEEETGRAPANRRVTQRLGLASVLGVTILALVYFSSGAIRDRHTDGGVGADALAVVQPPLPPPPVDPSRNVVSLEHGLTVYTANCVICHGAAGLGDGPQAAPLDPKPRNFSSGWFKIGTTRSGLPSDDDLAATIRHGMLPAAMPPWGQLTDGEQRSLALAVRHLAIEGRMADKLKRDPGFGRDKALALAHAALDSGPAIVLPPKPTKVDLERGKIFYLNNCAACHDPDGRGRLRDDLVDNDENPIKARDFTRGQFKGGDTLEDIAMRITRGIPGSPMPANPTLAPDDLWNTAAYVRAFFENAGK